MSYAERARAPWDWSVSRCNRLVPVFQMTLAADVICPLTSPTQLISCEMTSGEAAMRGPGTDVAGPAARSFQMALAAHANWHCPNHPNLGAEGSAPEPAAAHQGLIEKSGVVR